MSCKNHRNCRCGSHVSHLTSQTKQHNHDEEEDRPQLRQRHLGDSFRVSDKSQARSLRRDFINAHALFVRHEAEDGEDDEAGEEARAAVGASEDHRISKKNKTAQLRQKNSGTGKQNRYTFAPTG